MNKKYIIIISIIIGFILGVLKCYLFSFKNDAYYYEAGCKINSVRFFGKEELRIENNCDFLNNILETINTEIKEKVDSTKYDNYLNSYVDNEYKQVIVVLKNNKEEEINNFKTNIVDYKYIVYRSK